MPNTLISNHFNYSFFLFIVIVLNLATNPTWGQPTCNAIYLGVDGYVPGKCVTFHECPPLKGLLRSNSLTAMELKLLQDLTCTIDPETPTICCAVKDIPELSNYNDAAAIGGKPTKTPSLEDLIIYPGSKDPETQFLPQRPNLPNSINNEDSERFRLPAIANSGSGADVKSRNFNLLPKLNECGLSAIDSSLRIVGGKNAEHGSYPWMARIGYEHVDTGDLEFYCGATVISQKYILTAAHCSEEIDKTQYKLAIVRLGEHNSNTEVDCSQDSAPQVNCSRAVDFPVEKIIFHPGYNLDNKTNDIELIRVKRSIPFETPFVKPVCLPFVKEYGIETGIKEDAEDPNQFAGKKGVVSGWGRLKWNKSDGSEVLQEIKLPIVTNEECQRNYSTKITLTSKQMCAGGKIAEDSCGGDSGGPIVFPVPIKTTIKNRNSASTSIRLRPRYFQLGVVSFGPTHCGVGGLPGVYTRVAAYKDWILQNMEP